MDLIIKNICSGDISQVVKVHLNAFKGFFLTELGSEFLEVYYSSLINSNRGVLIGAFSKDSLLGFCAACERSRGFNSAIIRNNLLKYSLVGLKLLLYRPKALIRLLKNLTKNGDNVDDGNYAEVLSIAVRTDIQNSGIGRVLLENLEKHLRKKSIERLSLTTDMLDNDKTLRFYHKVGFSIMYEFETYPSRSMYRLIKNIYNKSL